MVGMVGIGGGWLDGVGRGIVLVALAGLATSCQLADEYDLPPCPAGQYRDNQVCKEDPNAPRPTIEIVANAGGTSCSGDEATDRPPAINPATLEVTAGDYFRFMNKDVIDHEVRGTDGQVWFVVKAGTRSEDKNINKPGSWPYRVSGCAKGGTLVVK